MALFRDDKYLLCIVVPQQHPLLSSVIAESNVLGLRVERGVEHCFVVCEPLPLVFPQANLKSSLKDGRETKH